MTDESKKILETLRSAVSDTLDKKRRLEQYAVVWKDNRTVIIENNDKKISRRMNE